MGLEKTKLRYDRHRVKVGPRTSGPGTWDPPQSLKVGLETLLKFKAGSQDPLQNLKVEPQDPLQSLKVGPS